MKLQTQIALVATVGLISLAGCTGIPGLTTTPSPSPTVAPAQQLSGRITFKGGNPGQVLSLGLKKYDGAAWQKITTSTYSADASGSYAINGLAAGKYQVFYDDQGTNVTDPTVNTTGIFVSEGADVTVGGSTAINFDVAWAFSPSIAPSATFTRNTSSFGFAANTYAPGAEYQIAVADSTKSTKWSSAWASTTSFAWNGQAGTETNSPTGAAQSAGSYYYLIKFRKAGTSFGVDGFYGQTKWVPFTLGS